MDDINSLKYRCLKKFFGHEEFRKGQEGLVDSILSGRDVLGIMPTGAGKSICYQLPALMMKGVTIVISPLISLMKDQVNSLIQAGIPTAYLNSSLTQSQFSEAASRARKGMYKLIYVAPERLDTPIFISLAQSLPISIIAVDEAHCVSQWGQDFRPSYLNIKQFANSLKNRPVMAAFTATATNAVRDDIVEMLGLERPYCVTTGFDRQNLYFSVSEPKDKLAETLRLIKSYGERSGIVYCSTRKNVEYVCEKLNENGISCVRYHGGLTDEERRRNQDDFIYDRVRVMAATNAFGMGIDKSNVTFVIHYNMPKNLEAYYQEAGRAGRDGTESECTLLFSRQDVRTNKYLIDLSTENPDMRHKDYTKLKEMTTYCTTTDCLRHYILNYFGEDSGTMCAKCSNCAAGFKTEDVTIASQKIMSCVYRLARINLRMGETFVTDVLRGSKSKRVMELHANELSTYGIMAEENALKIRAIINGLINKGYMRRGEHDELILSAKAKEILSGEKQISMAFKKSTVENKPVAAVRYSNGERFDEDENLFELLRTVRFELAQEAKVPAYIIFSDAALHDMCRKKPVTIGEFLTVSGVGQTKADRYGERFTSEINRYLEENGSSPLYNDTDKALMRRKKITDPDPVG